MCTISLAVSIAFCSNIVTGSLSESLESGRLTLFMCYLTHRQLVHVEDERDVRGLLAGTPALGVDVPRHHLRVADEEPDDVPLAQAQVESYELHHI